MLFTETPVVGAFQIPPHEEAKLVRCTTGAIYDVAIDLRPTSPTLGGHAAAFLSAGNRRMLYVPEGCAHGFLIASSFFRWSASRSASATSVSVGFEQP